jgi:hypothetical protein
MKCARVILGVVLATVALPLYYLLEMWMATCVEHRDANSFVGFVGWSAFFFYLICRGIHKVIGMGVDKQHTLK